MAASSVLVENSLAVSYKVGVNSYGKDVFKGQNFKNISATATDEDLVTLSDEINELLDYSVTTIKRSKVM